MRVARKCAVLAMFAVAALAQPISTKLLTFDLVAEDARGQSVADLSPADIRVSDAGRRQAVAYFRRGQDVADRSNGLSQARSNAAYPTFPCAVVLVIDQLNTRIELTGQSWDEIARDLRDAETPADLFLYVLRKNGVLYPIRELPDSWVETAAFRPPLREVLPQFEAFRRSNEARPTDLDVSRFRPNSRDWVATEKRRQSLTENAYLELTARLRAIPGPTSIVWVGSFANRDKWSAPVTRGNVEIHEADGESVPAPRVYYVVGESKAGALPLNSDVRAMIRQAGSDLQRGYRIGYFPRESNWDGRRHDVRITCAQPGIVLHGAHEYNAVRPVDIQDDRRQEIPDLISISPFDSSTIRFEVEILSRNRYSVRVNADDLLCPKGDCSLAVQAIHYLANGEYQVRQDAVLRSGGLAPIDLELPPVKGADRVRIVVADRRTRSFGTLTLSLPGGNP